MKICFPVSAPIGMSSEVYGHFGSAPAFVIVDSETSELRVQQNSDMNHAHGKCSPLAALGGQAIDAVIVGGIGRGALSKLMDAGTSVYKAASGTIEDNLRLLDDNKLTKFNPMLVCGGHGTRGGCSH